jgi:hypothetical protein
MSFFGKVKNFFSSVSHKASDLFKKLFGEQAANDFANSAGALLKSAAGAIVLDVVQLIQVSNPLVSGDDKRKLALGKLTTDGRIQALGVGKDILNLLIEVAVQAIVSKNVLSV